MGKAWTTVLVSLALAASTSSSSEPEFKVWSTVIVPCPSFNASQDLYWNTPLNLVVLRADSDLTIDVTNATRSCTSKSVVEASDPEVGSRWSVTENGSLAIKNFGWNDRGNYSCFQSADEPLKEPRFIHLDNDYRWHVYLFSLIYGVITAVGFLLLTLLFKLVYFLLET